MAYDINALYQEMFGRPADPEGLNYWQGKAPGIVAEGGVSGLREQMANTAVPADQAALMGRMNDPSTVDYQIGQIYRDEFARSPDPGGYDFWRGKAPGIMANGGVDALREQIVGTAAPADAAYVSTRAMAPGATNLTQQEATQWQDYMTSAANQQRGMNSMPFVAPNPAQYNGMSQEDIFASMFRNGDQQAAAMEAVQGVYGVKKDEEPKKDEGGGILSGGLLGFGL